MAIGDHRNPDGTYNGVGVMAEVSGLSRASVEGIWRQVKANAVLLNACTRHDFKPADPGVRSRRCIHCGGSVGLAEARWYELGRAHG
jgi:hypothetical protein